MKRFFDLAKDQHGSTDYADFRRLMASRKDAKIQKYMRTMSFCKPHKKPVKRLFDLVVTVPSVIFLSPLLVLIGILVRFKIGSPVLFRQVRPGKDGKPFAIYKFRTMTDELDKDGNLLRDGKRLTGLGRFLRI